MGLLDAAPPAVHKALNGAVLAAACGVFVAMAVTAPKEPVMGDAEALKALNTGDTAWMLISTAIVLLMTPGVCFFYGGMSQHKNVVSTIMQSMVTLAIIPILWSAVGFGLAFGDSPPGSSGIIGSPASLGGLMWNVGGAPLSALAPSIPCTVFFMFQLVFAVITPSLIVGSITDRVNPSALMIFTGLWHLVVYCPLAHMVWHPTGLIRTFGVLDFAGGTVVHMSSGYAALVAARYLGHAVTLDDELFEAKEPGNVPFVVIGTALLWMGWFGFNAGSAGGASVIAGQAFLTTNCAAASAMFAWMLLDHMRGHKLRATGACVGAVIGLVAITPAAGFVNAGAAFLIGVIGAVVCALAEMAMERWGSRYVDDTLNVFACHGVGGTVGMICTSLFATTSVNTGGADGAFYGNGLLLGKTLLVLVIIVPYFLTFTWGCLWVADQILGLRVTDLEQLAGLDVSKHGERAMSFKQLDPEAIEAFTYSKHGSSANGDSSAHSGTANRPSAAAV